MAKEKKNSNQVNQKVSLESLGSRTKATTTCEEANAPAPPTNCLLPSPLESFWWIFKQMLIADLITMLTGL